MACKAKKIRCKLIVDIETALLDDAASAETVAYILSEDIQDNLPFYNLYSIKAVAEDSDNDRLQTEVTKQNKRVAELEKQLASVIAEWRGAKKAE